MWDFGVLISPASNFSFIRRANAGMHLQWMPLTFAINSVNRSTGQSDLYPVVLAIGRDYADVAPFDGVVVVAGAQCLDISVQVLPMS